MLKVERIWQDLENLRYRRPLVHNITNFVVMNITANALLALGASPIMAHAEEELEELLGIAGALVINIGTLSKSWIGSMHRAANLARNRALPVVLDPVGAGASRLRTETALSLMHACQPAVVRGNASEIMALVGVSQATKGVDSTQESEVAQDAARSLARQFKCAVVASGAKDFITDGQDDVVLHGGSHLLPLVTGMGCTATALVGAFAAIAPSAIQAAVGGMAVMKVAGALAEKQAHGPGTFPAVFLDALHGLDFEGLVNNDPLAR